MRPASLFVAAVVLACACGPIGAQDGGPPGPAASIPVHRLSPDDAGRTLRVEAGDRFEVRLPGPRESWRWTAEGEGRIRELPGGSDPRALRLLTVGAGDAVLTFRPREGNDRAFTIVVQAR